MSNISVDRYEKLTKIMLGMNQVTDEQNLFQRIVEGAEQLVPETRVWFGELNYDTGDICIKSENNPPKSEKTRPKIDNPANVSWGKGITGTAIATGEDRIVADVSVPEWQNIYVENWPDTASEAAILVSIDNIAIREGTDVKKDGKKIFGVLNLESSNKNAFTEGNMEPVRLLASHAALLLERLDSEKKMQGVREMEQTISNLQRQNAAHEKVINVIFKNIDKTLGFSHINISLVDELRTHIYSAHFYINNESFTDKYCIQLQQFKNEADHPLKKIKGNYHIQADIVNSKKIEIPNPNGDSRFDMKLYEKYNHGELIRVYIPMIDPATDMAIGTLEAGYKRTYRNYICESDIQLLKSFVDYAVHAIATHREEMIERVIHELKAPAVAIRSHAELLQAYWFGSMSREDIIANKLQDILTDCEIILQNTSELEDILTDGQFSKNLKSEPIIIYRDVILKSIHQMKPIMQEYGLNWRNVEFNVEERIKKMKITTNKYRLNQVVYNLIANAIKYYDPDCKSDFKIVIGMSLRNEWLDISFKDWGMGIKEKYKERIFKNGFRTPEAELRSVTGSGLGLSISKDIMLELRGEISLRTCKNPTEFVISLPNS
jgi:signal transduction histidine kinase